LKKKQSLTPIVLKKKGVIPNEALDKILKHLGNVQKAPKALALIIQLIDTHMNELHHHHLFEVH